MAGMSTLLDARPTAASQSGPEHSISARLLTNALVLSALATAIITCVLLFWFDGWTYYRTPRAVRGYVPVHRLLRPSGPVGQALGVAGLVLMCVPMLYAVRKRWKRLSRVGSMKAWLEFHIFGGIVGPVFVTFHTSFKFNGIVSVAYWMMIIVASSGFVGRYLYVRIPRSLRGTELTLGELQQHAEQLKTQLANSGIPSSLLARINTLEEHSRPSARPGGWIVSLAVGDLALKARLWRLRHEFIAAGARPDRVAAVVKLIAERALLLRRLALLGKTKTLFDLWHVFHQPLVYFLFGIVLLHVGVVTYMGYTVFSRWFAR
jgi:hypothetical protein